MTNSTTNTTTYHPAWMRGVTISFYATIGLMGTLGNALVVFVVLRKRSMQTITNIFITNMAISDIIMSTLNVPLTPAAMFMDSWTLPQLVCKLMPMTMGVSVYVSSLTSTAIAVDRYFVIVHPFVPRMKTGLCLLIVFVVWLVASLISTPIAVFQKIKIFEDGKVSCIEDWKAEYRAVFTVISFVLQFLLPCGIITVCYTKVSITLSNRYKNNTLASKSRTKEELDIRRKRRTNRMLIAMVAIFVICWIPLNLLWMVKDISFISDDGLFQGLFFICHVLAMSSVMYNPFLYGWMNNNFQKEFKSLMPACLLPAGEASGGGGGGGAAGGESRGNTSYRYSTVDRNRQQANGAAAPEDGIEENDGDIQEVSQQQDSQLHEQQRQRQSSQKQSRRLVDDD